MRFEASHSQEAAEAAQLWGLQAACCGTAGITEPEPCHGLSPGANMLASSSVA